VVCAGEGQKGVPQRGSLVHFCDGWSGCKRLKRLLCWSYCMRCIGCFVTHVAAVALAMTVWTCSHLTISQAHLVCTPCIATWSVTLYLHTVSLSACHLSIPRVLQVAQGELQGVWQGEGCSSVLITTNQP
jgi:hypothetical protein